MNISTTLFLYFIVFCIGAAIGALIERALKGRSAPPPPPPLATSSNNNLAEDGDVEAFSAWRTRSNKVWLDMDGKRLENKETLLPEQRQRLLNLVLDLRPWLETTRPAASGPEVAPQPIRSVAPGPEVAPQPVRSAAPEPGVAPQPVRSAAPEPGVAPQTAQLEKNKTAPATEEARPAPALESIIEQIDKVLQVKLAASPFKDRGIRLTEGPGGIVVIMDGLNRYEGLDAIPDPEIKALIRQAVADWEKGTK